MKRKPIPRSASIKRTGRPARRTAVKRKRATPRRGRVVDKDRLEWAATQPCCITGIVSGQAIIHTHHVREFGGAKDDTRIIRLHISLHLDEFKHSIHALGKAKFEACWGISIEEEIAKLDAAYRIARETGEAPKE